MQILQLNPNFIKLFFQCVQKVIIWINGGTFYHDVDEIRWSQPITSLQLGHVTGQGSISPTWVGRVSYLGKIAFIKNGKNMDNIDVY